MVNLEGPAGERSIYLEGAGESKDLHTRCREGFRKLLVRCGFVGSLPRLVACGGREATFDDFKTALKTSGKADYVAMLVNSEDPIADVEKTWDHLQKRDKWQRPDGVLDEQVLLMTTCMETWIVSDRVAMKAHYGAALQESALPKLVHLETRSRHDILNALVHATKNCTNAFCKGPRSFAVLAELNPETLEKYLPSFARAFRILNKNL